MKYDSQTHNRRSIRLRDYDYSRPGAYFVTICTRRRACLFGSIINGEMRPNATARIVQEIWTELPARLPQVGVDSFVVMPNHIHAIIFVGAQFIAPSAAMSQTLKISPDATDRAPTLGDILRSYKAVSAHEIRRTGDANFSWQRGYYEHVIRNEESLNRIRQYITENPIRWDTDRENPAAKMFEPKDA